MSKSEKQTPSIQESLYEIALQLSKQNEPCGAVTRLEPMSKDHDPMSAIRRSEELQAQKPAVIRWAEKWLPGFPVTDPLDDGI